MARRVFRSLRPLLVSAASAIALTLLPTAAVAAEDLTVGVKEAAPFVMGATPDELHGFSIDLVREIASRLEPPRRVRFEIAPDLPSHLASVAAGNVDLGIAATNVTAARERMVDFSNPFFRDALEVAVQERDSSVSLWDAVRQSDVPDVLLLLLLFVVGAAHVVWFVERKADGFARDYAKGVGQGVWWTIVTMSTVGYGDFVPKTSRGRALAVGVIFVGIVMFGLAVASLTAAATAQQFVSPIERLSDLAGMRVGTLPESTASNELERRGIRTRPVASTAAGLEAVRSDAVDAFVHDRSQLLYALSKARGNVALVNRPFLQQSYALVFPIGSPLRKEVNVVLQGLKEGDDAPYDALYERWFPTR